MAIAPLPTNLYSGAAERINQFPHIQFQTQLMAHKQAKDEAIDNYYRKLPETLNDKGTRDIEVPIINQKKNEIQDYYMQNRDKITNPKLDNGAAQFNLQKMYRDAGAIIRESQNRGKTDLEVGKMRFQGDKAYIFQDPDFIKKIHAHSLPVGVEGSESIDLANVTVPPPPFDQSKQVKRYSDVKWDEGTPEIQPHPTDKYRNVELIPKVLGKEAKQAIYERAATDLENDPSFSKQIKETLAKNPQQLQAAAKSFKDNYGTEPESDHDLAAGYMINILPKGEIKQKTFDNGLKAREAQQRGFDHQELMRRIAKADAKDLIDYREKAQAGGVDSNNLWIDNYLSKVEENAEPAKGILDKTGIPQLIGIKGDKRITPDPVLYAALGKPDDVVVTPDNKYRVTFYQVDDNGNVTNKVDKSRSGTFTKDQIKLTLGYKAAGKTQLTKEMKSDSKTKGEFDDL